MHTPVHLCSGLCACDNRRASIATINGTHYCHACNTQLFDDKVSE